MDVDGSQYYLSTQNHHHNCGCRSNHLLCLPASALASGFGMYCLILLTAGLALAIFYQNQTLLPEIHPHIPAVTPISAGLIVYQIQTRFITGTVLLLLACLGGIGFLWFNPIFFNPFILPIGGLALMFAGSILPYLVLLNSFY